MNNLKLNNSHKIISMLLIKSKKNKKKKNMRVMKKNELKLIVNTLNNELKISEYEVII